jgi:heat shock protein HslJ
MELFPRNFKQKMMKIRAEIIIAVLFGFSALCMNCESAKKAMNESKISIDTAESATAPLLETHWKLIEINGEKIPDSAGNKEMYILLRKLANRVEGSGACNSFSGTYALGKNNQIAFSDIISTRMMCPGIVFETAFFKDISLTDHYSLKKDTLSFLQGKMSTVARFVPGK